MPTDQLPDASARQGRHSADGAVTKSWEAYPAVGRRRGAYKWYSLRSEPVSTAAEDVLTDRLDQP